MKADSPNQKRSSLICKTNQLAQVDDHSESSPRLPSKTLTGKKREYNLLDSEKLLFGDRCPKGFTKTKLLGKGGKAIVWLAISELGEYVALK